MKGLAILAPYERTGDAYKWLKMLERAADGGLVVNYGSPDNRFRKQRWDYAVVRGDHRLTYRIPLDKGIPYILFQGDVNGMVHGESLEEREMLENAAAVVFNCEATRDWCAKMYDLPETVEVVYLRPMKEQLRFDPLVKIKKSICYAGGLQPWMRRDTLVGYRVYHDIFRAFMAAGWQVHIYCPPNTSNKVAQEYASIGCVMHSFVVEQMLPMMLSQYTCGLQTFNSVGVPKAAMDYCEISIPNKTWLYLAANIPTLGLKPTGAGAKLYDGKWGIVVDRIEESYDFPAIDQDIRREEVIDRDMAAFRRLLCAVSQG